MKKLLKKISQGLIIIGLSLSQKTAQAQMIYGNSILCSNRNWTTVVALSTNEFNAVICNNNNENYYNQYLTTAEELDLSESIV